jgi:hypothetical protein
MAAFILHSPLLVKHFLVKPFLKGRGSQLDFVLQSVLHLLNFLMETTLTIRLPAKQREALKQRAAAEKRSESALVRDMIDREMQRGFDFNRVRHLVGSLASQAKHWEKNAWRKHIRQRNWRS